MKKTLVIIFFVASGALSLFSYNLIRVSRGYVTRVSDEELKKALLETEGGQKNFQSVLSKMTEDQPQAPSAIPSQRETVNREVASRVPANPTEPHQLTTHDIFTQLRDRVDGRMVADQNVLLGLMSRLQIVSEPTPEVSDFALSELNSFRAKKVFEDKGMAARYLQAAAVVYMQSTADGDRVSESMVRVVAQQEDLELRRILALTYLERNQEKRDGFLKRLEAKGVSNTFNPPNPPIPPPVTPVLEADVQPEADPN